MNNSSALLFDSRHGRHLFVVDGSRIYDIDETVAHFLSEEAADERSRLELLLASLGQPMTAYIDDSPLSPPPLRSISLAVAQKCNLACGYCYAQGGSFGAAAQSMPSQVARESILALLSGAQPGSRVNIAFMGGEPLVNRSLIREATQFAVCEARRRDVQVGFSMTTNGTLIEPDDAAFFEEHGFALTISLDGLKEAHDRLRPTKGDKRTFDRIVGRIGPLLRRKRRLQVTARVTVTPLNLDLMSILDGLIGLGFDSVGFSPMLSSPTSRLELDVGDLRTMLHAMIACGRKFETEVTVGRSYPFANITDALREIHRGSHRPYPCGAGAGYMAVSADGGLFACHRFVQDDAGRMGSASAGPDQAAQKKWLSDRHVQRQEPCRSCWARYLCGGGCHHEVIHRGRPACDFIRGWLSYCLSAYVNVAQARPDLFSPQRPAE